MSMKIQRKCVLARSHFCNQGNQQTLYHLQGKYLTKLFQESHRIQYDVYYEEDCCAPCNCCKCIHFRICVCSIFHWSSYLWKRCSCEDFACCKVRKIEENDYTGKMDHYDEMDVLISRWKYICI